MASWNPLTTPPTFAVDTMLLLTDGSVMCHEYDTANWHRLVPDALGSYMRVSKADGSQATDLQRDALRAAAVDARHFYEDAASGKRDDQPRLAACLQALPEGDTLVG